MVRPQNTLIAKCQRIFLDNISMTERLNIHDSRNKYARAQALEQDIGERLKYTITNEKDGESVVEL